MLIIIHAETGEGSLHYMKPLIESRRTLVVCSRSQAIQLERFWPNCLVTYASPLRDPPEGKWDQLFIDHVKLTPKSKVFERVVKVARDFNIILMRPVMVHDAIVLMRAMYNG